MSQMKSRRKTPLTTKRKRVLIVDDHPLMREGVARWIQRAPELEVCGEAESASQAVSLMAKLKPDLVLTDISLTGRSGLELIKGVRYLDAEVPIILMTGYGSASLRQEAATLGVAHCIDKPFDIDEFLWTVSQLLPRGEVPDA